MSRKRRNYSAAFKAISGLAEQYELHPNQVSQWKAKPQEPAAELKLLRQIDEIHLDKPFLGSRGIRDALLDFDQVVNRKRVQRLMRVLSISAVAPKPGLSKPGKGHKVYPYLLRNLEVERANQVWAADITYIPLPRGFMYLVSVIDWYSRKVFSWRLGNTMEADFCVAEALEGIGAWIKSYTTARRHQPLGRRTPDQVYDETPPPAAKQAA
jgi:putative transposase